LNDIEKYRISARKHAESVFDVDAMVDKYLDVLLG
jgi:hypothetical protein